MRDLENATEADIATALEAMAGPLAHAAGIGSGTACHPTAIKYALAHCESLNIEYLTERAKSWFRLHSLAFRMIACKKCGGKGEVYPNFMAFGDKTGARCPSCRGDGLAEGVTQKQYAELVRRIGKPLA
jgi:hypothetical protein